LDAETEKGMSIDDSSIMVVSKQDDWRTHVCSWCPDAEEEAQEQISNTARLPFIEGLAIMPDCHKGYGVTIGSVVATNGVIMPSAVGVDIGCGVLAVRTNLTDLETEDVKKIMGDIRKRIPVGFNWHKTPIRPIDDPPDDLMVVKSQIAKARLQLATLGSGNHFIELQKGDDGYVWFMIHSGSRNLGKQVADHYTLYAKSLNAKWFSSVPPEWDLSFLPIEDKIGKQYMEEMKYAVDFALYNRQVMADLVRESIAEALTGTSILFEAPINIAHNYAAWENHKGINLLIHRKGATSARKGEIGIIPGSQGSASYIVEGLGNPKSFNSCSHGAGRRMGRKAAMRPVEEGGLDLAAEIKRLDDLGVVHGIRNRSDLDEAAGAYKDIDKVMENQKDLVKILTKLTPLGVVKG
jgi:tRNA-splicing ligase RtcB (3'-phosphate/5'-hydroxy nucleic acid ligase)